MERGRRGGRRTYVAVGLDGGLDAHVGAQGDLGDVVEELQAVQLHGLRVLHHGLFGGGRGGRRRRTERRKVVSKTLIRSCYSEHTAHSSLYRVLTSAFFPTTSQSRTYRADKDDDEVDGRNSQSHVQTRQRPGTSRCLDHGAGGVSPLENGGGHVRAGFLVVRKKGSHGSDDKGDGTGEGCLPICVQDGGRGGVVGIEG